ncbi:hypothetical protein ACSQ67_022594 [Phaseolus vulgaris]
MLLFSATMNSLHCRLLFSLTILIFATNNLFVSVNIGGLIKFSLFNKGSFEILPKALEVLQDYPQSSPISVGTVPTSPKALQKEVDDGVIDEVRMPLSENEGLNPQHNPCEDLEVTGADLDFLLWWLSCDN